MKLPVSLTSFQAFVDALHRLPTSVGMSLSADIRAKCKTIAQEFVAKNVSNIFVLGKGPAMPIALEGKVQKSVKTSEIFDSLTFFRCPEDQGNQLHPR